MTYGGAYFVGFVIMVLSSCSTLQSDKGDHMAAQLKAGLTKEEVIERLGKDYARSQFDIPTDYKFFFVQSDVSPYDLAARLVPNMEIWVYPYWFNSNTQVGLNLFFDRSGRLAGWSKPHSELSREKYKHEKLTSQLRYQMRKAKVSKLLGEPQRITELPEKPSADIYVDHYWFSDPARGARNWPMWVYSYPLSTGDARHVYVFFDRADRLLGWGYDRAHEEAERYIREKSE